MISYRKLAMRVLGHSPVSAVKTARRSTAKRAAALALTAALVVGMTLPAFADTWYIDDGDISISAGTNGNNVTQGSTTKENDTDTVITNRDSSTASSNTVTIDADEGKTVNVTLDNVTINVDEGYKYGYDPNAYKTAVRSLPRCSSRHSQEHGRRASFRRSAFRRCPQRIRRHISRRWHPRAPSESYQDTYRANPAHG